MECSHMHDKIVWIGNNGKVYSKCTNCNIIISLSVNFELVKKFPEDYKPKLNPVAEIIK